VLAPPKDGPAAGLYGHFEVGAIPLGERA
jgi:hypothetical protein